VAFFIYLWKIPGIGKWWLRFYNKVGFKWILFLPKKMADIITCANAKTPVPGRYTSAGSIFCIS
jgi:hypothetical protein